MRFFRFWKICEGQNIPGRFVRKRIFFLHGLACQRIGPSYNACTGANRRNNKTWGRKS
jgi:hypothetical protein